MTNDRLHAHRHFGKTFASSLRQVIRISVYAIDIYSLMEQFANSRVQQQQQPHFGIELGRGHDCFYLFPTLPANPFLHCAHECFHLVNLHRSTTTNRPDHASAYAFDVPITSRPADVNIMTCSFDRLNNWSMSVRRWSRLVRVEDSGNDPSIWTRFSVNTQQNCSPTFLLEKEMQALNHSINYSCQVHV